MQRGDDLRTLADGSCDALNGARPHIADGEDTRHVRFQGLTG